MKSKDHLREDELDGIGNMCAIRAIGFANWLVKNYQSIVPENYWANYTGCYETEELYREYLKTLDIWRPSN